MMNQTLGMNEQRVCVFKAVCLHLEYVTDIPHSALRDLPELPPNLVVFLGR